MKRGVLFVIRIGVGWRPCNNFLIHRGLTRERREAAAKSESMMEFSVRENNHMGIRINVLLFQLTNNSSR